MAAYRQVYDSRHLHADCLEPGSAPNPTVGNQVWANLLARRGRVERRGRDLRRRHCDRAAVDAEGPHAPY